MNYVYCWFYYSFGLCQLINKIPRYSQSYSIWVSLSILVLDPANIRSTWAFWEGTGLAGFPFHHFDLASLEHRHDSQSLATILWPWGRGQVNSRNLSLIPLNHQIQFRNHPSLDPQHVKKMNHYMVKSLLFGFSVTSSQTQIPRHKLQLGGSSPSTSLLMHVSQLPPQAGLYHSTFIHSFNKHSQAPALSQGPGKFWGNQEVLGRNTGRDRHEELTAWWQR